jgi:predicted metalloendopeptidase
MNSIISRRKLAAAIVGAALLPLTLPAAEAPPKVPRFSLDYMDKSVKPGVDFFHYAAGTWIKKNPVPPDKSRWGGFMELQGRNWFLIHPVAVQDLAEFGQALEKPPYVPRQSGVSPLPRSLP